MTASAREFFSQLRNYGRAAHNHFSRRCLIFQGWMPGGSDHQTEHKAFLQRAVGRAVTKDLQLRTLGFVRLLPVYRIIVAHYEIAVLAGIKD